MDFITTIIIAIALAMDAFSVSITKGFTIKNIKKQEILWLGLFFGGFQTLMPFLGWIAGIQLQNFISIVAPWVAFILLSLIGVKMIYESINKNEEDKIGDTFSFKELTLLAIATSIDAFAVGITFALLNTPILIPLITIGIVSFVLSLIGINIGKKLGSFFGDKFEIIGGIVLILLGIKILLGCLHFIG